MNTANLPVDVLAFISAYTDIEQKGYMLLGSVFQHRNDPRKCIMVPSTSRAKELIKDESVREMIELMRICKPELSPDEFASFVREIIVDTIRDTMCELLNKEHSTEAHTEIQKINKNPFTSNN